MLKVIPTHFGRLEDLRTDNTTNKNTDQLGYTDAAVNLHTDQPFIENPPQLQLLHCLIPAQDGGDNFVVNGVKAAEYLKSVNPIAFKLLTETKVKFHRKQKQFESIQIRPIISLDENGAIKQFRYSYFTYAPHVLDFDLMTPYYQAYNEFANLVRDKKHQYYFKLSAGDFVLYDNHKMLHARTQFSGTRWLRGIYFDYE